MPFSKTGFLCGLLVRHRSQCCLPSAACLSRRSCTWSWRLRVCVHLVLSAEQRMPDEWAGSRVHPASWRAGAQAVARAQRAARRGARPQGRGGHRAAAALLRCLRHPAPCADSTLVAITLKSRLLICLPSHPAPPAMLCAERKWPACASAALLASCSAVTGHSSLFQRCSWCLLAQHTYNCVVHHVCCLHTCGVPV